MREAFGVGVRELKYKSPINYEPKMAVKYIFSFSLNWGGEEACYTGDSHFADVERKNMIPVFSIF